MMLLPQPAVTQAGVMIRRCASVSVEGKQQQKQLLTHCKDAGRHARQHSVMKQQERSADTALSGGPP